MSQANSGKKKNINS